jgi:Holliday junction resolvase
MTNRPKRKGTRNENKTRDYFEKHGINAKRVPGSGAFSGLPLCDVVAWINGRETTIEVKARKQEPKVFAGWLGNKDLLFIWSDYSADPLVILRGKTLMEFIGQPPAGKE